MDRLRHADKQQAEHSRSRDAKPKRQTRSHPRTLTPLGLLRGDICFIPLMRVQGSRVFPGVQEY